MIKAMPTTLTLLPPLPDDGIAFIPARLPPDGRLPDSVVVAIGVALQKLVHEKQARRADEALESAWSTAGRHEGVTRWTR